MADLATTIAECSAVFQKNLDNTSGALFIGLVISVLLLGITNLQVYMYYQRYTDDRLWYKFTVLFIWATDLLHTALVSHLVYWYLVTNYFKPWELTVIPWSFRLQVVVNTIAVYSVHILYYIRLWKLVFVHSIKFSLLTKVWCAVVTFFIITGTASVGGIFWALYTQLHVTSDFHKISYMIYIILSNATALDIIFAASFCAHLGRHRKTSFIGMQSTIPTIITYIVSTNLLTSLSSLSTIILCAAMPDNYIYVMMELLITKLYFNSYMAMLNARRHIQANANLKSRFSGITTGSTPISSLSRPPPVLAPPRYSSNELKGYMMESMKVSREFEDLRRVDLEAGVDVHVKDERVGRDDKEGLLLPFTMQRARV